MQRAPYTVKAETKGWKGGTGSFDFSIYYTTAKCVPSSRCQLSVLCRSPRCWIRTISLILTNIFQGSEKVEFIFCSMRKWDIKGAEPAHSEVDIVRSLAPRESVQNTPSSPCLHLPFSPWHPSDMSPPLPPHLPPSHSHLFRTRCVTFRFTNDFSSGEWANPVEQFNQIQKDLDHLRNWASRWQM